MNMIPFESIILTDINVIRTIYSPRGKNLQITNRSAYGLSFCSSGQITYTMNGEKFISEPNHAVFLPEGATYTLHGDKTGIFSLIDFQCENFPCDTILVLPLRHPETYIKFLKNLSALSLFPENRLRMFSIFYEMLYALLQEQLPINNVLYPVIQYIAENFADPALSNSVLAEQMGVSEGYLRKLFLSRYNTTPKQFVLDVRIQKAKQLLANYTLSVAKVSEACGFSNQYHFCRAFRERTGTTPTEYAKRNRIFEI